MWQKHRERASASLRTCIGTVNRAEDENEEEDEDERWVGIIKGVDERLSRYR